MNNQDNDNKRPDDEQNSDEEELFGWLDDDDEFGDEGDDDQMSFEWEGDDPDDADPADERGRLEHPGASQKRIEEQMQQAEDADFGNTDDLLDWMQNPDDDTDEPQFADEVDSDNMAWMDNLSGSEDDADDGDTGWLDDLTATDELGDETDTAWLDRMMETDELKDDGDTGWLNDLAQSDELSEPDTDTSGRSGGTVEWDILDTGEMASVEGSSSAEDSEDASGWDIDDFDADSLVTGEDDDTPDTAEWGVEFMDEGDDEPFPQADEDEADEFAGTFDEDDAIAGEVPEWLDDMELEEPDEPDEVADDLFDAIFDDEDINADAGDLEDRVSEQADDERAQDFDALFDDMEFDDADAAAEMADADPAEADWLDDMDMPDEPEPQSMGMTGALNAMFGEDASAARTDDEDDFDWLTDEDDVTDLEEDWLSELEDTDTDTDTAEAAADELDELTESAEAEDADYTEADATADDLLAELGESDDADLDALLAELDESDDVPADAGDMDDDAELAALLAEMEADEAGDDTSSDMPDMPETTETPEPADAYVDAEAEDEDDFFSDMDAWDAEDEAEDDEEAVLADEDFFADLDTGDMDAAADAEAEDEDDFFSDMDAWETGEGEAELADEDFFADLDISDMDTAADEAAGVPAYADEDEDDLDALLASFELDDEEAGFEDDEEIGLAQADDLDAIFGEMAGIDDEDAVPEDIDLPDTGELEETGDIPDWLREAAASSDDTSAAALVRQRKDRSLDDLDERLLGLRERGLELSEATVEDSASRERFQAVVPDIKEGLTPAQIERRETRISPEATFTDAQRQQADVLRSIAGSAEDTGTQRRRTAIFSRLKNLPALRWLVTVFLLLAVITPFVLNVNFGSPPPIVFESGSPQSDAFFVIDTLQPADDVLLAVEYGATGARELDPLTRSVMEHLFVRGVQPVIISSNAVGLLRGETIAADLIGADGQGDRFFVARYLPGGNIGLRDLALSPGTIIPAESGVTSLDEFERIIVISEDGETVRQWMEQVEPSTDTPFIIGVGQSAQPLARPYFDNPGVNGYLVGAPDAFTYNAMNIAFNGDPTEAPTATNTPTITPTATETPVPTEAPATTDPDATTVPGAVTTAEATEEATATPLPTDTPAPTATATQTPTPVLIEVATIIADARSNVRGGPGTGFGVVAGVDPGERFRVLGREAGADFEWINIQIDEDTDGWIAAFLVDIEQVSETEFEAEQTTDDDDSASAGDKTTMAQTIPSKAIRGSFARRPPGDVQQQDAEQTVRVGRNVAGITIPAYSEADTNSSAIAELAPNAEVLVIDEQDDLTQVLLEDQREGWVESRLLRVDERPITEVDFAPTPTPIPTRTPTPSPTLTPTPFQPQITPAPLPAETGGNSSARFLAVSVGTLAAILMIGLGNIYWVVRWLLRGRKQ